MEIQKKKSEERKQKRIQKTPRENRNEPDGEEVQEDLSDSRRKRIAEILNRPISRFALLVCVNLIEKQGRCNISSRSNLDR